MGEWPSSFSNRRLQKQWEKAGILFDLNKQHQLNLPSDRRMGELRAGGRSGLPVKGPARGA